jgi:dTDP-glucose 4,6-dehydratase
MRILVTGAHGIVGKPLVARLRQENEVLATDLLTGYADGYSRVDVTDRGSIDEALEDFGPELVVHMAGEVGRLNGEKHPERMIETNALGTMNVARSCVEHSTRLMNFSTSEVYGDAFGFHLPVIEQDSLNAFGQSNIYSLSKCFGEAIVKHYVENYGLRALTIRPFMLYGEGEVPNKYRSALTNFVWAALNGKPFDVHRNTRRAWCHVSDFAEGIVILLDNPMHGYQAFNIGSEEYHSMEEVARMVVKEVGADEALINLTDPPAKFGSPIKVSSIEKMKALGYAPTITLDEGIRRLVKWQRDSLLKSSP